MLPELGSAIVAGAYALFAGYSIGWVQYHMRRRRVRRGVWDSAEMGAVERLVFFGAVLSSATDVIAGWFFLKIASSWSAWRKRPGVFNRFVVGAGLNLIFGTAGGLMPQFIDGADWARVVILGLTP